MIAILINVYRAKVSWVGGVGCMRLEGEVKQLLSEAILKKV